jgi:hypothetical protein
MLPSTLSPPPSTRRRHPGWVIFSGVAISLTVFRINLLGDALRDTPDPRLSRQATAAARRRRHAPTGRRRSA